MDLYRGFIFMQFLAIFQSVTGSNSTQYGVKQQKVNGTTNAFPELIQLKSQIDDKDTNKRYNAVSRVKTLVATPISRMYFDDVIISGMLPGLIECLNESNEDRLQFMASWVITNIASGNSNQTRAVVDNGAVPPLIALLSSSNVDVQDQALWALANVIGDSSDLRDYVIAHGFIPAYKTLIESHVDKLTFNIAWVFANLCRCSISRRPPPMDKIIPILPIVKNTMLNYKPQMGLKDTLWGSIWIVECGEGGADALVRAGFVPKLVQLLDGLNDTRCQRALLTVIRNIIESRGDQRGTFVSAGIHIHLEQMVNHDDQKIRILAKTILQELKKELNNLRNVNLIF